MFANIIDESTCIYITFGLDNVFPLGHDVPLTQHILQTTTKPNSYTLFATASVATDTAIQILNEYPHLINSYTLSSNPHDGAIEILQKHPEFIDITGLSRNTNSKAGQLLQEQISQFTPDELQDNYFPVTIGLNCNPSNWVSELFEKYPDLKNGERFIYEEDAPEPEPELNRINWDTIWKHPIIFEDEETIFK